LPAPTAELPLGQDGSSLGFALTGKLLGHPVGRIEILKIVDIPAQPSTGQSLEYFLFERHPLSPPHGGHHGFDALKDRPRQNPKYRTPVKRNAVHLGHRARKFPRILSSRDLGLLTLREPTQVSKIRKSYEAQYSCALPHTGALHDMGSCVSHKTTIIKKVIFERRDPAHVARECNHSQAAVDRYLKDYHRVKTLYRLNKDLDFIHLATQIAKHVIAQYIQLIHQEEVSS